jgi:serine phosphatase RsbU (regulator of sigma subunit)
MLLFTDGVTEARANGDLYGEERLEAIMSSAEATPESVVAAVLDDVLSYQHGRARDDIALVAFGVPA